MLHVCYDSTLSNVQLMTFTFVTNFRSRNLWLIIMNLIWQAQYLEPRLLGVLAFFDSQLMNSNITLSEKELASRFCFFVMFFTQVTVNCLI